MIIDCHGHPDWHGHDLGRTLANMERYGIDMTWLLTWDCPADEYSPTFNPYFTPVAGEGGPLSFARCLSWIERAPGKFVPGWAPDPRRPDSIDRLEAAVEIHRVRVCGELKLRMMYDNPDALRMFRFCGRKKLPVLVHIDYELGSGENTYPRPNWWYGGGIEAFERAVAACPETVFIGHAPGFWAHISGDRKYLKQAYPSGPVRPRGKLPRLLRKYPNLYADISAGSGCRALSRDRSFSKDFLLEFQDRVLYGRDFFDNDHQELLNGLDLPAKVLGKIYSKNALRLVPLE